MSIAYKTVAPRISHARDRRLRLLLVTQAPGGGVGRHFLDMAEAMSARGVEVTGIYSPRKLDAQFVERLQAGSVPPMFPLMMRRAIHPLDAADLWRLVRFIRALGPFDLIHAHSSKGGALARLAACRLKIPTIYTPHAIVTLDPTLRAWQRHLYKRIELWLARRTDAIIAVSQDEADHMRELGFDGRKVHVVPNGIDRPRLLSREEARTQLGIPAEATVVGFVGRLTRQKAPDVMVEAFAAASRNRPDLQLVMVGSGPAQDDTRRHVERLGLTSRVKLLGNVAGPPLMPAFDMFCLSSRYEAMPYVYLEALAAGLPIVSTRVGGATTSVKPYRNGLIVPPDDVPALAAALTSLADDPKLRRLFAAGSLEMSQRFTAANMVDQTLNIYDRVLSQKTQVGEELAGISSWQ